MTLVSGQVRVPGTGELSLAPVGTALPANASTALNAAFSGYGLTTDAGVTLTRTIEREGVPAWQSVSPVRWIITGQTLALAMSLLQVNKDTLKLWLASGDFAGTTPNWKADIPINPEQQAFAAVMKWEDTYKYQLQLPKVEVTEQGDINLARSGQAFPVTLTATPPDTGIIIGSFLTNDPAFDPAA